MNCSETSAPKVSILVPIYNVEKYLRECLNSLVNQTLKDIEIICINDGSTDASNSILEEFSKRDERIVVINKENTGYGNSMNLGLKQAKGEYIGIVESDDFCENNMFDELYLISKENNLEVIRSDYYCYWSKNNENRRSGRISKTLDNKITNAKSNLCLLKMQPAIWSGLYKKSFLEDNNILFLESDGASYQDTGFFLKVMMCADKVMFTTKPYIHYRQDNINSSVKSKKKIFCICDEYDEVERYLKNRSDLAEIFMEYLNVLRYRGYFWNILRIDETLVNDFVERFSSDFERISKTKQLSEFFFSKINKSEFDKLINDKKAFLALCMKKRKKSQQREFRKNLFSIHINASRISIVLFNRQILRLG